MKNSLARFKVFRWEKALSIPLRKGLFIFLSGLMLSSCLSTSQEPSAEVLLPEGISLVAPGDFNKGLSQEWEALQSFSSTEQVTAWAQRVPGGLPIRSQDQVLFLYITPAEVESVALSTDFLDEETILPLTKSRIKGVWWLALRGLPGDFSYIFYPQAEGNLSREVDPYCSSIRGGKFLWSRVWNNPQLHGTLILLSPEQIPAPLPGLLPRSISVYLPPGFDPSGKTRYPVMYWCDGQNLWDSPENIWGGWKLDTVSDDLITRGTIPGMIHVGINWSNDRLKEYMGYGVVTFKTETPHEPAVQVFELYKRWVVTSLKPWLDKAYPTDPIPSSTGIGGSSAGGAFALAAHLSAPQTFGKAACLSLAMGRRPEDEKIDPDLGPGNFSYKNYRTLFTRWGTKKVPGKIWLDIGTEDFEKDLTWAAQATYDGLLSLGYAQGDEFQYRIIEGGNHRENDWSTRLPEILTWLWKNQNQGN